MSLLRLLGMILTKKQKLIRKYENKHRPIQTIFEGAVRSGKTFLHNILFLVHVGEMRNKKRDFIITGHTMGSLERNVLKPFNDEFGFKIRLNQHGCFELVGNKVHCFGTDNSDSYKRITGFTSYGWLANEVTLQHQNSIQECFNRCSGEGFRIFWDTNPDFPEHPVKLNYIDKSGESLENGRERIKSWHFKLDDNEFLSKEYVENLKLNTPAGMWYDRKVNGLWVAAEGIVYENFNRNIHVVKPFKIPDSWSRYRVIDWGFQNPFVCLWGALDPDRRLYIYREHYKSNMLIKDHARVIKSHNEYDKNDRVIRYRATVADHDAQDNAEIKQYGIHTVNANKDIEIGIQRVAERMIVQKDNRPRLYFFDTCVNSIRELGIYVWEVIKDGKPVKEKPLKVNDHTCDALRYLVMYVDKNKLKASKIGAGYLGV